MCIKYYFISGFTPGPFALWYVVCWRTKTSQWVIMDEYWNGRRLARILVASQFTSVDFVHSFFIFFLFFCHLIALLLYLDVHECTNTWCTTLWYKNPIHEPMRKCLLFLIFIDTINCSIIINLNDNGPSVFCCSIILCLRVFMQPIACYKIVIILSLIIDYLLAMSYKFLYLANWHITTMFNDGWDINWNGPIAIDIVSNTEADIWGCAWFIKWSIGVLI